MRLRLVATAAAGLLTALALVGSVGTSVAASAAAAHGAAVAGGQPVGIVPL